MPTPLRPMPLTTPTVNVLVMPKGSPTAIDHWPTFTLSESPSVAAGSLRCGSILMSARSV